MNLSSDLLETATGCTPRIAEHVAPYLEAAMVKRAILDNPRRAAHFLAQCAHESALFTRTEENLNYSAMRLCAVWPGRFYLSPEPANNRIDASTVAGKPDAIANVVYGGRMGNREVGDGWKYRGRGFVQITGRDNYEALNRAESTLPCVSMPEAVASTEGAAVSAAWFWWAHGLNIAVDAGATVERITRAVNGGTVGLAERTALTNRALAALGL